MAYSLDPFADLLRQRPPAGPSGAMNRDSLETRRKNLDTLGLEGTGLDRLNESAIQRFDAKDATKEALKQSAMKSLVDSGAAAAL